MRAVFWASLVVVIRQWQGGVPGIDASMNGPSMNDQPRNDPSMNDQSRHEDLPYYPTVMSCVLARNKAHTLPYFLGQLEELDYPKDRIHLHIRTDHNVDETVTILDTWTKAVSDLYAAIDYRSDQFNGLSNSTEEVTGPFIWTDQRYHRIISLKEEALQSARRGGFDYLLLIDADNFLIYPRILQRLMHTKKSIVAPLLRSTSLYSNFWAGMDENGYYLRTEKYEPIYQREIQGCIQVPMIHSAILINLNDPTTTVLTFDRSKLMSNDSVPLDDVLIFARSAQEAGLGLHLLNTHDFGYVLPPSEEEEPLEADVENMRYMFMEASLLTGPPGLLHSPFLNPMDYLLTKTVEPGTYFDKIYLINLRRRPDRRTKMEWCLRILGINATLVEAVDGKTLTDEQIFNQWRIKMMPEYKDPYHKRPMTRGEIGCFLSHYQIWQDILEHKYQRVIVFEDDLRFIKYFRSTLSSLMQEADERIVNWDLIYLGRKRLNPDEDGPMVPGCRSISHVGYSYWTLSYVLTYTGAMKLIQERPLDRLLPVDEYLPIMFDRHPETSWKAHFKNRNLLAYTAEPLLVFPTHYTGQPGYISDTENAPLANSPQFVGLAKSHSSVDTQHVKLDLQEKRAVDEL